MLSLFIDILIVLGILAAPLGLVALVGELYNRLIDEQMKNLP